MARTVAPISVAVDQPSSLARYAVIARVDHHGTRSAMARRLGITDSSFSKHLDRLSPESGPLVSQIDRVLGSSVATTTRYELRSLIGAQPFLPDVTSSATELISPGLSLIAHWGELFPHDQRMLDIPAAMYPGLVAAGTPRNSSEVLVRSAALLSMLNGFRSLPDAARVAPVRGLHNEIAETTDLLLTVASGPPNPSPAAGLTARFGEHILPMLWRHLTESPVGFRVTRVIINMARHLQHPDAADTWTNEMRTELLGALGSLLDQQRHRSDPNAFPARGLNTTAYLAFPQRPEFAWMNAALADSAAKANSLQERAHAALALARRGAPHVGRVLAAMRVDARTTPGMAFIVDTLQRFTERTGPAANSTGPHWSPVGHRSTVEMRAIADALRPWQQERQTIERDDPRWLPPSVHEATETLIYAAASSLDATVRRRACDALAAAHAAPIAAEVLCRLLDTRDGTLAYLHQNAAITLSFLQVPAIAPFLVEIAASPWYDNQTRFAALWSAGDLTTFVAPRDRSDITTAIRRLLHPEGQTDLVRAGVYSLALLRSQREALASHTSHDDLIVRQLARWGVARIAAVGGPSSRIVSPLAVSNEGEPPGG